VHLDQIPDELKQLALVEMEGQIQKAKSEKAPGETEVQHKFKEQVLEDSWQRIKRVTTEGGQLTLQFNVDQKAGQLTAEMGLTGKPGSKLTANINELGKSQSLFAGALGKGSALSMLAHWTAPPELRQAFEPVVDELVSKALQNEKDETKRKEAEKFLKALDPSFKSGEIDVAFSFRGPTAEKHYTILAGIKVKDGAALDTAVRDLVKALPERDRAKVKFDIETVSNVKVHRVDAQKEFDAKTRETVGDHPIYVAIRDDAVLVTVGPNGLNALKEMLAAQPKVGPQFQMEMSMARLAPLMARENKHAAEAADKAFGKAGKDKDKIRFSVEADKTFKVHFSMEAAVVTFFSLTGANQAASPPAGN
jgi:hypothetical protein